MVQYQRVLGVFFAYCVEHRLVPVSQVTAVGCQRFLRWYVRHSERHHSVDTLQRALRVSLRAYAWALAAIGHDIPPWSPAPPETAWSPIVTDYVRHSREHRGLAEGSLARDAAEIERFLADLKRQRRKWKEVRLVDIDQFLLGLSHEVAPTTIARVACALRGWLRFLHATGRVSVDLASSVVAPVRPHHDRPPRAWPWARIKKLLHGIDRTTAIGCRDHAQFLLMSACGLGAAEVLQLRLEDIDWRGQRLHVVRRKTKAPIALPLLPEVARALANYIRNCRPKPTAYRQVFLSQVMPHKPFEQSTVLRHRVRTWARRAGVEAPLLGTHLIRHSHATRHVVLGTSMKTLGDILGHRDPETTSIYARAAVQRLRRLALAVPR
jgi:site-specific recombinase XerD